MNLITVTLPRFAFFGLLFLAHFSLLSQCVSNSPYPWLWPSHKNWFIAPPNQWNGQILDMSTGAQTSVGTGGPPAIQQYEGTSTVSDDKGNLLFYTNGRRVFKGVGGAVTLTYAGLLEGNEGGATGTNGSAVQGVITVRHPLNPDQYYVFTTDDANSGATVGLNYFVFDKNGSNVAPLGANRLGAYRSAEGIAATKHANGVDIWITVMGSGTSTFYSYLLTCIGLTTIPVASAAAPNLSGQQERGGIAFSSDGSHFAAGFGSNNYVYLFDNSTGVISDKHILTTTGGFDAPYDLIFSPDGTKLYYTAQMGNLCYYDISGWPSAAAISATRTATAVSSAFNAIEYAADGFLYISTNRNGGPIAKISGNYNTGAGLSASNVASTIAASGLPTMYLPPADKPVIAAAGPFCDTDAAVDLSTNWTCAAGSAEGGNPAGVYTSNCGACITDATNGTFDPTKAGVGAWQIIFTRCLVADTIDIVVNNCGACPDTSLSNSIPPICPSGTIALNTYKVTVEAGAWSIQSGPAGYSASITGSTFNGNSSAAGSYVIRFTLSTPKVGCPSFAERTVVIKANPTISMADQNICTGDSTTFDAGNAGATFLWSNQGAGTIQTTKAKNAGTYTVAVTVNGCTTSGSATLTLKALPVISMSNQAICAGDSTTFDAGAGFTSYTWSANGTGTVQTTSGTNLGTYTVAVIDVNGCKDTASANLTLKTNCGCVDDNDQDGVCDEDDLDDDNDGILDVTECPAGNFQWSTPPTVVSTNTATGTINGFVNYTYTSDKPVQTETVFQGIGSFPAQYNFGGGTNVMNTQVSSNTITFSQPVTDPILAFGSIGAGGFPVGITFSNAVEILWSENVVQNSLTQITGSEGHTIIKLKGVFSQFSFNYLISEFRVNFAFGADFTNDCDIDNDGIANSFDLDSDADGCADAIEGGATFKSSDLSGQSLSGSVDAKGVPIVATASGQTVGSSQNVNVQDVECCTKPTVSTSDTKVCVGSTITANPATGGTWTSSNTSVATINNAGVITGVTSGTATFTFTNTGGCSSTTNAVTVNTKPQVTLIDAEICAGDSTTFDAGSAGASFVWSNQGTGTNQTTKAKTAGTYTVEVIGLNGCKNTTSAVLTVNVLPTPTLNDASVCLGGFIVLQPSPSTYDFYEWSTGVSGASKDTIHYSKPNTTVWVKVTNANGCSDSAFANITMGDTLHVDFGGPKDVCADQSIVLNAAQYGPFTPVTHYTWTPAAPDQATLSVTSPGTYSVLVEDGRGCQGDAQVEVTIRPLPAVDLHDSSVCFTGKEVINVSVLSGFKTYSWSTGSILNNTIVLKPEKVKLIVTNNFDCAAADSAMFTDFCEPTQLCFPNVVTPNGDGNNDEFMPCKDDMILINDGNYKSIVNNILHIDLQIYDRWGVRVFQSLNTLPSWDCTYRGNRVAPGVYYYVVRYTDSAHNDYEQTGWVQVLAE